MTLGMVNLELRSNVNWTCDMSQLVFNFPYVRVTSVISLRTTIAGKILLTPFVSVLSILPPSSKNVRPISNPLIPITFSTTTAVYNQRNEPQSYNTPYHRPYNGPNLNSTLSSTIVIIINFLFYTIFHGTILWA
jgi:hypothetical protein